MTRDSKTNSPLDIYESGHVHLSCVVCEHCKNPQKRFFAIDQPIDDISLPNFQGICKTI